MTAPRSQSGPLPDPLTLLDLQRYVVRIVAERGFTQEVDRVFILLVEELGELAEQMEALRVRVPGTANVTPAVQEALGFELADVVLYLVDLANGLGVDLAQALAARTGVAAPADLERASLAEWQMRLSAGTVDVGGTWLELIEATGRTARVLRKRWAGLAEAATEPLGDAVRAILRLASAFQVDLTGSITEKERANAQRTWTF
jgi:dCTP diphosphatase